MIDRIKQFFDTFLKPESQGEDDARQRLQLAATALLMEMTRVDDEVKAVERQAVARAVRKAFGLAEADTAALMTLAESEAHNATCYHEFTRLINSGYDLPQKIELVELLWEVAYADSELEMYEEHLVRKLADLLYVPHADFIQAKLRVLARHGAQ
jgi:uncharacterized tellurite resistance protein B-like protein